MIVPAKAKCSSGNLKMNYSTITLTRKLTGKLQACRTKMLFSLKRVSLDVIDKHKHSHKSAKFSFSVSGVFFEQCEMFNKDVMESFKQLSETGRVEFLG